MRGMRYVNAVGDFGTVCASALGLAASFTGLRWFIEWASIELPGKWLRLVVYFPLMVALGFGISVVLMAVLGWVKLRLRGDVPGPSEGAR